MANKEEAQSPAPSEEPKQEAPAGPDDDPIGTKVETDDDDDPIGTRNIATA